MKGKKIMTAVLVAVVVIVLVEIVALVKLKNSVTSYKQYWEAGNSAVIDEDKQLYVALGDSAAQGIGASKPENGYVGLVAVGLTAKNNKPTHTINLSVSGAKIQDAIDVQLPKLKEMTITDQTVVTLEIGANDMVDFDAKSFEAEMDALLAQMPKQTAVADVPYFGGGLRRSLEPRVLEANKIIERLVSKHGLTQVPLHTVTKERDNLLVNAADAFHPSNKGYRNWYEAFRQALNL